MQETLAWGALGRARARSARRWAARPARCRRPCTGALGGPCTATPCSRTRCSTPSRCSPFPVAWLSLCPEACCFPRAGSPFLHDSKLDLLLAGCASVKHGPRSVGTHTTLWTQDVAALVETEAVRCVFIQDNPAYDDLRTSLGLRASAAAPPPPRGVLAVSPPGGQVGRNSAIRVKVLSAWLSSAVRLSAPHSYICGCKQAHTAAAGLKGAAH